MLNLGFSAWSPTKHDPCQAFEDEDGRHSEEDSHAAIPVANHWQFRARHKVANIPCALFPIGRGRCHL
jgi:hypothetical protein